MSPGDRVEWDLPPGASRTLRGGYESQQAGAPAGMLELTLAPKAAGSEPTWSARVELTADLWHWHGWSVKLPARGEPTRLVLAWHAAEPGPDWRSLFVTEPSLSEREKGARAIVLLVVDTLRADHVSAYGYRRPTTPRLDAYFRSGLRAENCYPEANWTLPSHASLFTSTSVARHGVARYGRLLPEGLETLAGALAKRGYRTAALSGGGFVDAAFGFDRGFDRFALLPGPAKETFDRALKLLAEYDGEPVFLFLHTYQVHDYVPDEAAAASLFPGFAGLDPNWRGGAASLRPFMESPRFADILSARYDASLRSVDAAFGGFLDGLARLGRLERTAILFTSDHGEALCDRMRGEACLEWGHGSPYLFDEELRVPLEARIPWRVEARGIVTSDTTLLDVAPTLVDAAGGTSPATFEGRSLLSRSAARERVVATEAPPLDAVAVRQGNVKLIRRTGVAQKSVFDPNVYYYRFPEEECHDLARDPREASVIPCPDGLREGLDRYLSMSFAGSVVLRVPASEIGGGRRPAVVTARGRRAAPAVRTFGLAGEPELQQRGATSEARFGVGIAPVWIAFEPTDGSEALELELRGLERPVTPGARPLVAGSHRWSELKWAPGAPLPDGVAIFTVPPAPRSSTADAPLSGDLVARLLSLGYVQPGPSLAARLDPVRVAEGEGAPLSPGELVVRFAP